MLKVFLLIFFSIYASTQLAAAPIHWKIQSNKLEGSIQLKLEKDFASYVAEQTDNQLIIEIRPPKGFVPVRSAFNATRRNIIQGMFMSPQNWGAADPVFSIMGDLVTAWNQPREYYRWLEEEQGIVYLEESYKKFGMKLIGYMISPVESLVSRQPINGIDDFIDQRIRTPPGMIFDYFTHIGAKPKVIDVNQVRRALAKGRITCADYSNITVNYNEGFYQDNKYTNYPGFHSMPLLDFVVNKQAWELLNTQQQEIIATAIRKWQLSLQLFFEMRFMNTLSQLKKQGIFIANWSPIQRIQARKMATPIWKKYADRSPQATELMSRLIPWLEQIGNL